MRRVFLLTIAVIAAAGCTATTPSLHSLATQEQLAAESDLTGYWYLEDDETIFRVESERNPPWLRIDAMGDDCEDFEEEIRFWGALTQIEEELFLSLTSYDSDEIFSIPIYESFHVEVVPDGISLSGLDPEWLEAHLEANPGALEVIWREAFSDSFFSGPELRRSFVITAPTEALRDFYLEHLDTDGAYDEAGLFGRLDEAATRQFEQSREACLARLGEDEAP